MTKCSSWCHQLPQSPLPDEVQRLVFVPDAPASPSLIEKMPVILGTMRLDRMSALVSTLMRQRVRKSTLQEEGLHSLTICESLLQKQKPSYLMRRKSSLICVVAQKSVDTYINNKVHVIGCTDNS